MEFGPHLREERERLGVPLSAVADGTKFSLRHLEALENGDGAALPGGVFNRGLVQSYCRYLGIDESQWLNRLSETQPEREPQEFAEFAEAIKRNRVRETPLVERRWAGVLLMLVALCAMGWAAWHFVIQPRVGHLASPLPPQATVPASNS
ncbi:MAG: helix-turn-helix domain-containing protein [Acidobacteriaceae bacterium]|nr:helix-turn-helix domain-containing protein [Acidobacteriaceae bacterium]